MKTAEGRLKARIRAHLISIGAWCHAPVPSGYGTPTLDILACVRGRFLAVEAKTPGREPTPRQHRTAREIEAAGGVAFWCDSFEGYLRNMALFGFAQ